MARSKPKKQKNRSPRPGFARQREPQDVPAAFERPYEMGGETVYDDDPSKKPQVNVRETPLEHMYARGVIADGEKRAGDWFRRYAERVERSNGVIEPDRIRVDISGSRTDPITDKAMEASDKLRQAREKLGPMDFILLYEVCAVGHSFLDIAKRWYMGLDRTRTLAREAARHIGRRVRDALAILADTWGTHGGSGRPMHTEPLRNFDKAALDPANWNYSPEQAKLDNKARRRRRRKRH